MNIILEYFIVFIGVFIFNYFATRVTNKKLSKNQVPTEVLYLKKVYQVTIPKKSYSKFMMICSLINTFIISTIYMIIMYLLNHIILRIIIGVILLILMIIICYGFLAKYYLWKEGR